MRHITAALLATTALLTGFAQSASAADLPVYKAPPVAHVPPWTWTGCYVGAHIGSGWGNKVWEDQGDDISDNTSYGTVGFLGGAQIGCDYQWWDHIVIGAEGTWSGTNIKGSGSLPFEGDPTTIRTKIDWLATLTGRVGFTAAERTLIYGKAGVAWANETHTQRELDGALVDAQSITANRVGWLVGAGVEYAITKAWTAKLEYNYIDFGTKTVLFNLLADDPASVNQQLHTIKFGVNYRFGAF
jgi:outer membrane immunogenic protein